MNLFWLLFAFGHRAVLLSFGYLLIAVVLLIVVTALLGQ